MLTLRAVVVSPDSRRSVVAVALLASALAGTAAAQQVVASLAFPPGGLTAGSSAQGYLPPNNTEDIFLVEDLILDAPVTLSRFESRGWVFPAPLFVHDVTVRIYRDWSPAGGTPVASSIPGTGTAVPFAGWGLYSASFADDLLPAGSYHIAFNAITNPGSFPLFWSAFGPHTVAGGLPDNGWRWTPSTGTATPVPAQLGGIGQSGVNFILYGLPAPTCRPDLTSTAVPGSPGYGTPNGVLNTDDFFYYLIAFTSGNLAVADLTTTAVQGAPGYGVPNGVITNDDFFYYLTLFTAGC